MLHKIINLLPEFALLSDCLRQFVHKMQQIFFHRLVCTQCQDEFHLRSDNPAGSLQNLMTDRVKPFECPAYRTLGLACTLPGVAIIYIWHDI